MLPHVLQVDSMKYDGQREVVRVLKVVLEEKHVEVKYPFVDGDVEEVGDLSLESIKDEEVATVDGVFEGTFGALGDKT
ncbi:hypothetical protein Tco_0409512 [Tanacetum coccineum]